MKNQIVRLRPVAFGYRVVVRGRPIGHAMQSGDGWHCSCAFVHRHIVGEEYPSIHTAARAIIKLAKMFPDSIAHIPTEDEQPPPRE